MDKPKEKEVDDMGVTVWYDHPVANSYPRKYGKKWMWCAYDEYPATPSESYTPLKRGDRVRIREGYDGAGEVYFYIGKSTDHTDMVNVGRHEWLNRDLHILAAAIEPYPYSREERIERAIEDFIAFTEWTVPLSADDAALLFAILDAGV
jgi:hypothetical protein